MEFRQRVRELGFAGTKGEVSAVDALFDRIDLDGSADIDMVELRAALNELKQRADDFHIAEQEASDQQERYVGLAAAATAAAEAMAAIDGKIVERAALVDDARVEARLGGLLVKRCAKVDELAESVKAVKEHRLAYAAKVMCSALKVDDAEGGVSVSIGTQEHVDKAGLIAHLKHELGLEAADEEFDALANDRFFTARPRVESISLEHMAAVLTTLHEAHGEVIKQVRALGDQIGKERTAAMKLQMTLDELAAEDATAKIALEEAHKAAAVAKAAAEAEAAAKAEAENAVKKAAADAKKAEFEAKVEEKRAAKPSIHESKGEALAREAAEKAAAEEAAEGA